MDVTLPAAPLAEAPAGGAGIAGWRGLAREAGAFLSHRGNLVGAIILGTVVLLAVAQPLLPLPDPYVIDVAKQRQPPSAAHPLGTDSLGRDLLSRIVLGARVSLVVATSIVVISTLVGIAVGMAAGYFGRRVDGTIMGLIDILLAFPGLLLAIAFVAVFGRGVPQVILAACIAAIPRKVRLQRASVLTVKERAYVDAARLAGASHRWIITTHILPNTIVPMIVVGTLCAANAILIEASLSFLGLGIVPPQPSWGNIVSEGRLYLRDAWWISTFAGLAIVFTAVGLTLLGDGIRDRLDPRLRA